MEKLVKLLNEKNGKESYRIDTDSISGEKYINRGDGRQCFIDEHIISKKFGFIEWLVEKDKIDTRKLENYIDFHNDYKFVANRELKDKYPNGIYTDHLLMLLSIQNDPIEFLISILK